MRKRKKQVPKLTSTPHISYLLKCFLTVQAGGGHLRQQDGHILLLLPQPDEPLPYMGVHHAQRHLFLPTQGLVQICKVSSDAGAGALCCAGDLKHTWERSKSQNRSMIIRVLLRSPLSYMFSVCHAYSILNYLLATFYLLHNAHQLPRVLGHLLCEGSDTVGHVQNGCTNLIGFSLKNSMLLGKIGQYNIYI